MGEDIRDILKKYGEKIEEEIGEDSVETFSREYIKFKEEQDSGKLSFYEKACNFCESILKVRVGSEKRKELIRSIDRLELDI
ncbi:unnamed protein product, partial [marine sediment metagenome]